MIQLLNCLFSDHLINELRFSVSISLPYKSRLTSATCFGERVTQQSRDPRKSDKKHKNRLSWCYVPLSDKNRGFIVHLCSEDHLNAKVYVFFLHYLKKKIVYVINAFSNKKFTTFN